MGLTPVLPSKGGLSGFPQLAQLDLALIPISKPLTLIVRKVAGARPKLETAEARRAR
jgi:hypothetical protein